MPVTPTNQNAVEVETIGQRAASVNEYKNIPHSKLEKTNVKQIERKNVFFVAIFTILSRRQALVQFIM